MNFKIGDRVRLIKHSTCTDGFEIREICKITNIDDADSLRIHIVNNERRTGYVDEEHIEKVEFTKDDLQDGDIVIYRNGEKAVVGRRKKEFKSLEYSRVMYFEKYDNELGFRKICKADKEYDIIKVERPVQYETVFERK